MQENMAQEVLGTTKIVYNGIEMDLGKPFERITMVDAVKKYSGAIAFLAMQFVFFGFVARYKNTKIAVITSRDGKIRNFSV